MSDQTVMERYAAMPGRYFDDFQVGDIYHHLPGRTISQQDNAWFTLLTMNTHPLHFDEEYAAATEFGKPLVASPLTVAIVVGMSVSDVSAKAIANLGWKDIKLTKPVFPGETLALKIWGTGSDIRFLTENRKGQAVIVNGRAEVA